MDIFGLLYIPDFLVWVLLVLAAVYLYGTWTYSTWSSLGYSGPKPKPFIGNNDLIFGQKHWGAWDLVGKKEYGKIVAMYVGRQPNLVVFDTDMLKQILTKDFSNFADRRDLHLRGDVMTHALIAAKGAEWKRLRSLNSPFFTLGKLKRNIPLLGECLKNLITICNKDADGRTDIDIRDITGAFTLEAICLTAFGVHVDSQNDPNHALLQASKSIVQTFITSIWVWLGFTFPFVIPVLEWFGVDMWPAGSIEKFGQLTKIAIEERQKSQTERPDFIQALIKAHETEEEPDDNGLKIDSPTRAKPLTDKEIVAQAAQFIMAGYDTVASSLSFLLFCLANDQACQDKVLREINDVIGEQEMTYENLRQLRYLDMCLEESLRLYPPVARTTRQCRNDVTINGCFIPKGTMVSIPIYALQRDPEFWDEPEKYDPERFSAEKRKSIHSYTYQPFGMGPRSCVGMRLAQIEVKMAAIQVIKHFHLTMSEKTKVPLKQMGLGAVVDGGVWLRLTKR